MIRIRNITSDPNQRITLLTPVGDCVLFLRFRPAVQSWFMSMQWRGLSQEGHRIAAGLPIGMEANWPFSFYCHLPDGDGIDPYRATDFSSGRAELYFVDIDETAQLRGTDVEPFPTIDGGG